MDYFNKLDFVKKSDLEKGTIWKMLNQMMLEVDQFSADFKDSPQKMSGWGHLYFCEIDGGQLIYDRQKPHSHVCSICGTEYQSKQLEQVWTYFYRNEAIDTALKAAVLYQSRGRKKDLEIVSQLLGFYAQNYHKFEIHARDTVWEETNTGKLGYARIMPQELNEAIIAVKIVNLLELVKNDLPAAFIDQVYSEMFSEIFRLLAPQVNRVHNKPCWCICAIGCMGLISNNQSMIDFAFKSDFNINRQLREGVTEAGIWYEGSIFYHFFTIEGLISLLHFSQLYDQECCCLAESIQKMLKTAFKYAFDNLVFPNPNDGWPDINLKTFSYLYHLAYKIYGETQFGSLLRAIESASVPRTQPKLMQTYYYEQQISLQELMFNSDFNKIGLIMKSQGSQNFEASHVGVLKNERVNVFIKYGHRTKSHAHADKMNLEVTLNNKIVSRDLSNSGYTTKLCNEWHRITISHNTVAVNGKSHQSYDEGHMIQFEANNFHAVTRDVYQNERFLVNFERKVNLLPNGFNDQFEVRAERSSIMDWFFHFEANVQLLSDLEYEDFDPGFTTNGYQHISKIRKVKTEQNKQTLEWKIEDLRFSTQLDLTRKELLICETLDNPINRKRTTIVVRKKGVAAFFITNWMIK